MRENTPLINNKNNQKAKEKLAENYLAKYLTELKMHFNFSDNQLKRIIFRVYNSLKLDKPLNKIINMIKFFR